MRWKGKKGPKEGDKGGWKGEEERGRGREWGERLGMQLSWMQRLISMHQSPGQGTREDVRVYKLYINMVTVAECSSIACEDMSLCLA